MQDKTNNIISGLICFTMIALLYLINFQLGQRSSYESGDDLKKNMAVSHIKLLAKKVCEYSNTKGKLPHAFTNLVPSVLSEIPKDPYGRDYALINNGANSAFIYYYGKDGKAKGLVDVDSDWAVRIQKINNNYQIVYE